jgi:PAS domain S-box-containing protein
MSERTRKSGIGIIEDIPWGTHFCQFYQTKEELLDILVPYFKAGFENNEFCLWITAEPLDKQEALEAFSRALPNLKVYLEKGQGGIIPYDKWYLKDGIFNPDRVLNSLTIELNQALTRGYDGLRLAGNISWLERKNWRDFKDHEAAIEKIVDNSQMLAICSYCLDSCTASDFIDVVCNHQLAIIKKDDNWRVIEGNRHKQGALRTAEEKLRVMFESVPVPVVVTDLNGSVLDANETAVRQGGFNNKVEMIGLNCLKVVSPEDVARVEVEMGKKLAEGNIEASEYTLIRKDGTEFIGEISASFIRDASGNPTAVMVIVRDISERKRAEKALRESEERYHSLITNIPDVIWTATTQGDIIFISPNTETIIGYTQEEILRGGYQMLFKIIHPDDFNRVSGRLKPQIERGMPFDAEYRIQSKAGQWVWLHTRTNAAYKKGNITYIDGITTDITERKRIEEALQKSEAEYRLLVENANEGIIVVCDGMIQFINPKVVEIAGYSRDEVISTPFINLLKSEDTELILSRYQHRVKGAQLPKIYDLKIIDKNGNTKRININVVVTNWEGRPATLNFMTDITERQRMEEQLKEYSESLEKMVDMRTRELKEAQEKLVRTEKLAAIGQLAGSVSHELRSPLAAIRTSAYFLKAKLGNTDDDKVTKHLAMLDKQVTVCDKIITDILGLARLEKPKVAEINVNKMIQEQVKAIEKPKNLEISTILAENLPAVMADSSQLERVLLNLISNAIQAMPRGGKLIFYTNQKNDFVEVKVTDTGDGIASENLIKVFEPLFTTKAKGVGLGLSISKALIEKQGGTLEVESQVGQGTTFTIRLPVIGRKENSDG